MNVVITRRGAYKAPAKELPAVIWDAKLRVYRPPGMSRQQIEDERARIRREGDKSVVRTAARLDRIEKLRSDGVQAVSAMQGPEVRL